VVQSKAKTVAEYLASLPPERRSAIEAVRRIILKNLPRGFKEGMQFGMIGYCVPLSRYPNTYNGQPLPLAALASQKNYMSVYLMSVYGDPATRRWFETEYRRAGKRLDLGGSCVRFRTLDDLPLTLVGAAIARVKRRRLPRPLRGLPRRPRQAQALHPRPRKTRRPARAPPPALDTMHLPLYTRPP
jgi:hypothetical protein